jgi:steroid delta-isomerase-like uncharacterized protein
MAGDDLIKKARENLAAFNAKDWNKLKNTMADDTVYDEEATHRKVTGADHVVKALKLWADAFPDAKGTEVSIHSSGDTVIMEILWEGTHKGPLFGPMASIKASGKKVKVPAVEVFRFDNGKIVEDRHYFDLMTILQQIGAMPAAGPQPAAP